MRSKRLPLLCDNMNFYGVFLQDLRLAKREIVIESPFMTIRRVNSLLPVLKGLASDGVSIVINTKPPVELDELMAHQANSAVAEFQRMGATVLYTVGHHRKLAIIDCKVVWQGSLNILSQYDSCEIMSRFESKRLAREIIDFTNLRRFV